MKTLISFFPVFEQFCLYCSLCRVCISILKSSREIFFLKKGSSKSHKTFLRGIATLWALAQHLPGWWKSLIGCFVPIPSTPSTQEKGLTLSQSDKELCPLIDQADSIGLPKGFKLMKNTIQWIGRANCWWKLCLTPGTLRRSLDASHQSSESGYFSFSF